MAKGKPVTRALMSAAALPLMAAPQVHATEEAPTLLPDLTVTAATRTERQVEHTPAATEILTAEQLQRSGAATLGEALRSESSISVAADGSSTSIRGGNRSETLYLVDGRRLLVHTRNVLDRIPVSHVERIEIVKGPGSATYGSDALAGVINVITRRPEPGLEGGVELQTGAPTDADGGERHQGAAYLGGGTQDTRFRLFADAVEQRAHSEETTSRPTVNGDAVSPQTFDRDLRPSADVYNLRAGLTHWFTEDFHIDLEAAFMREERQERYVHRPPTETGDGGTARQFAVEQTSETQRRDLAAKAEWLPTETLQLRYQIYESRREMERANAFLDPEAFGFDSAEDSEFAPREPKNILRVNELKAQWQPMSRHTVTTGFEHQQQVDKNRVPDDEPREEQWIASPFVQHDWQITDRLQLIYGARHDETSEDDSGTSLQAGAEYRLAPSARLRAHYAEGFKMPDLRQLHIDARNPRGDRVLGAHVTEPSVDKEPHELAAESSRNFEVGIAGDLDLQGDITAFYDVGLFYTEYDDRISQVPETNQYRTFRNVEDARTQGTELQFGVAFDPQLELSLAATYLDAIDRDSRETLPDTPEWTAVAKALWTPTDPLELQLRTRYVDEVRARDDWDSAYTLTSLDVGYAPAAWDGLRLQGGIENLLDEGNDSSLRADPGRFARAGVRYDF
ncbi:TonB-dependent siderophore receptor [Halorhodospira sp. 9622]|uniref:TonB-dependent receptor plug domain-containing protein n=1 Tax=Halorhodospira sp. 9622 TaxID=2899136 RepID=UPI001EE87527|nr:TonB-dependent receptor [Halorhodospira sp. 9622]MCG5537683.1 TonB-dependent receptor [Halorhodospira sp. 9622]